MLGSHQLVPTHPHAKNQGWDWQGAGRNAAFSEGTAQFPFLPPKPLKPRMPGPSPPEATMVRALENKTVLLTGASRCVGANTLGWPWWRGLVGRAEGEVALREVGESQ